MPTFGRQLSIQSATTEYWERCRHPRRPDFASGENLPPLGSGTPWRAGAKATLIDLQQTNLRLERRTREPESCGRSGGTRDLASAGPERLFDNLLLLRGQPAGQTKPAFGDGASGKPAVVNHKFVAVRYDDRSLDDVLQLANVPRPGI